MGVKRAWFIFAGEQRLGPFSSRETAEEEAYRIGATEIEERYISDSCSEPRVEVAVIHRFVLRDAERDMGRA